MMTENKDSRLKTFVVPKAEAQGFSKCYVCDQTVSSLDGTLLLKAMLPFSNLSIPQKIGKLLGHDCMVLVYVEDRLCLKCTNLFFELDRFEAEVINITKEIVSNLTKKYNINKDSLSSALPLQGLKRKFDMEDTKQKEAQKKLEEMFGSEIMIASVDDNTKRLKLSEKSVKSKNTKPYRCPICREGFSEQKRVRQHIIENHLSKYKCNKCFAMFKDEALLKKHLAQLNCENANDEASKKFKCAICSQKFETKEHINIHLHKHKAVFFKCGSCGETFQRRDILMKHLELHVKPFENKTSNKTDENISANIPISESKTPGNEMKFLECKSCSLSYIDNEHYSLHLSTSHRKVKQDVKEEKIENSNNADLEKIFEKLHSDTTEEKTADTNNISNGAVDQVHTQNDVMDLFTESFSDDVNITSVSRKVDYYKQNNIVRSNKVYLYKCPGCSSLYDNSNDLQLHILTAGHVEYNSEIQILEVDSSDALINNTNNKISESNNEINILPFTTKENNDVDNQTKLINLESTDSNSDTINNRTNNIQFITSNNGNEVKLITFHDDSNIKMVDLQNSDQIVSNSEIYNDQITLNTNQNTSKAIGELLESAVGTTSLTVPALTTATTESVERSKIQIIDEKTIDISQLINGAKDDLETQDFQLNDLCNLTVKTENQVTNQVSSSDMYLISNDFLNASLSTDITSLMTSITKDLTTTVPTKNTFSCGYCKFKCTGLNTIKLHMKKHKTTNNAEPDFSNAADITSDQSSSVNLECKLCNQTFKTIKLLNRHNNQLHRKSICAYCNKNMTNSQSLRMHEMRHLRAGDVCRCADCGKEFKTKWGLNNHRPVHTGNYKLFCEFCNRGFMSKVILEEHRSKHTKEERCVCDICGKKFQFKSTYWIHRKWHDTPFPYKCDICHRKFRHTSVLAVHRRKHTGERPYECPYCKQTFPASSTLKRHLIIHTGNYPYYCERCDSGFTTRHNMAVHLSKKHGDSKLLNQKTINPDNYKMAVRDDQEAGDNDFKLQWANNSENIMEYSIEQNGDQDSTASILINNTNSAANLFNNLI